MTDVRQLIGIATPSDPFGPSSRYRGLATATIVGLDGREIVYVTRRFVPQPELLEAVAEHIVTAGERLDQIAAAELGDPEQFWRICDANNAMRPDDLTEEPGQRLLITLPPGFQGGSRA